MHKLIVPRDVKALATRFAEHMPMRRGSVSERFVKCNRPGCPCADRIDARHGPYYSISRIVKGKTQSRWLNAEQVNLVRAQVEAGQQFRRQVEAYWTVCELWADAQLQAPKAAAKEVAKKGASKKPLTRRSSPRSKCS